MNLATQARLACAVLVLNLATGSGLAQDYDLDELLGTEEEAPNTKTQDRDRAETQSETEDEPATAVITLPEDRPEKLRPAPAGALEEIVVTAQRRAQSLQDTPISLAAFNAEQLEVAGIHGMADLGAKVPSLQIEPFPTSNATLRFYIRGIGIIDSQITQDPAVGVYADGVYIARSTGNAFDIADLERIEILRGPQGTLYGRNTTGGAVNLITRRPSLDAIEASQSISLGARNQAIARSSLNLPLSDTLALKFALHGGRQDGFVENDGPGGDYGDRRSLSSRLDLRWLPDANWTLDYTFDRSEIGFYNYSYQAVLTPESDKGQVEQIKREAQANSLYSEQRLRRMATGAPLEESLTRIDGHALTLQRGFGEFDLKYQIARRELFEAFYTDLGGGAGSTAYRLDTHAYDGPAAEALQGAPTPLNIPLIRQQQWSHELQALGSAFNGRVDYVLGLFYFTESAVEDWQPISHQFSATLNPGAGQFPLLDDPARTAAPRLVTFTTIFNETENDSGALFGQATWTPEIWSERLHLTLGYRHSEDRRFARKTKFSPSYVEEQINGEGAATELAVGGGDRFEAVPGRLSFADDSISFITEYDYAEDINLYGKYVEAYKSGGFNIRDPQIDGNSGPASDGNDYGYGFADGFDKELVKSLEFGIKSEWLQRRLRVNADVFYTAYEDMQINFILAGTIVDTKTTNAGRARMWGLEADANYIVNSQLRVDGSYAYLNAAITEVIDVNGANVADRLQFNSAPRHSLALNLDATVLRRDWGELLLNLGYQYTHDREGGANAGKPVDLRAYQLLNLRLGTSRLPLSGNTLFSAALWVRNVLDEVYEISAIDNLPHADRAVLWGEPRSFGLDLHFSF